MKEASDHGNLVTGPKIRHIHSFLVQTKKIFLLHVYETKRHYHHLIIHLFTQLVSFIKDKVEIESMQSMSVALCVCK